MPSPEASPGSRGYIVPIGGAEDRISDRRILQRFVDLCGGKSGAIAVVPTASMLPTTGEAYRRVFLGLGIGSVAVVDVAERAHAEEPRWPEVLAGATGVFLTGGNQLRLSTILGGTPIATQIRRSNARGVHVAGTSAGAAFLCEHMIAHGSSGSTPRAGQVALAPGLGLTNRIVIDQHFRERDRLGRLLTALSYNPFSLGFGLDEDTAAFVDPDDHAHILGSGGITIVDVSQLSYSSMAVSEIGDPVELVGVRLSILAAGASFDLSRRLATPGPHRPSPA